MVLKANELRLNNLLYDNLGRIVKVSEIREEHIVFYLSNNSKIKHTINSFKQIPLTEEWLLKFGFIQCDGKFGEYFKCSKLDGFRIWFNENEHTSWWSIGRKDYDNDDTILIFENCKTLHQLQNLYFALTQEELEIKM